VYASIVTCPIVVVSHVACAAGGTQAVKICRFGDDSSTNQSASTVAVLLDDTSEYVGPFNAPESFEGCQSCVVSTSHQKNRTASDSFVVYKGNPQEAQASQKSESRQTVCVFSCQMIYPKLIKKIPRMTGDEVM
jgi:hypothetical protein